METFIEKKLTFDYRLGPSEREALRKAFDLLTELDETLEEQTEYNLINFVDDFYGNDMLDMIRDMYLEKPIFIEKVTKFLNE